MADTKLRLLGVGVSEVNSLHFVYDMAGQDPDLKMAIIIVILDMVH